MYLWKICAWNNTFPSSEPKSVSKAVFDKELARFYANVNANTGTQTGALLIAVRVIVMAEKFLKLLINDQTGVSRKS
jgi:hypothetical protein